MTPETRARMDAVQARLVAAGVKDVKFTKDNAAWNALTAEQRAIEICDVLEAYLNGECKPIPKYNRNQQLQPDQPAACQCAPNSWGVEGYLPICDKYNGGRFSDCDTCNHDEACHSPDLGATKHE